jgi:hypothetical protein
MPKPTLTADLASTIDQLVDADRNPSHGELTEVFRRADVLPGDPLRPGERVGKVKRVRAVASWCATNDPASGWRLMEELVSAVRAEGGFVADAPSFVGAQTVANLRRALEAVGYTVDDQGELSPLLLDNVPEVDQDAVLAQYAVRLRRGALDSPLVTGTGKDLLEATARHVLVQSGGTYDPRMGFPGTLVGAYTALGLSVPPGALIQGESLDPDPIGQLQQAAFLLAVAVNRLRNSQGTGHGRPYPSSVTERQAELATQSIALTAELLLRPR